jgi:hypothetical protein
MVDDCSGGVALLGIMPRKKTPHRSEILSEIHQNEKHRLVVGESMMPDAQF